MYCGLSSVKGNHRCSHKGRRPLACACGAWCPLELSAGCGRDRRRPEGEERRVIPLRMKLHKSSTFLADSMRRHRWGREPNPFRNRHGQPREKIGTFPGACGEKWNFSRRTNTGSRPMGEKRRPPPGERTGGDYCIYIILYDCIGENHSQKVPRFSRTA